MNRTATLIACFIILALAFNPVSFADEASILKQVADLQNQMAEMKNTMNWQKDKIRQLENQTPGVKVTPSAQKSDFGENYFENNLKSYIGDSHKWLKDLKYYGNFRLRYEARNEQDNSTANDRNRFRFRLRFGFEKQFSDELKVNFRLVSAPGIDAARAFDSTNTTFDNQFAFKDISIDRAYAAYTPNWAKIGPIQSVEITGGKFPNPLKDKTVKALWDGDIVPEGLNEQILIKGIRTDHLNADLDLMAGQWLVEEGSGSENDDAELYVYSFGLNSKIKDVFPKTVAMKNYVNLYWWSDYSEAGNFGGVTKGNFTRGTALSTGFKVMEFYNELAFDLFKPLPKIKLFFDWSRNLAENAVDGPVGADQENHYTLGAKLGKVKKKGSWEASYEYIWLEANAFPGLTVDSDFSSTDRRGSVIKLGYGLTDFLQLNFAMFFTNNIQSGLPSRGDFERDLFQTDLVWKF